MESGFSVEYSIQYKSGMWAYELVHVNAACLAFESSFLFYPSCVLPAAVLTHPADCRWHNALQDSTTVCGPDTPRLAPGADIYTG